MGLVQSCKRVQVYCKGLTVSRWCVSAEILFCTVATSEQTVHPSGYFKSAAEGQRL